MSSGPLEVPENWYNSDSLANNINTPTIFKSTNAKSGNYAALIVSANNPSNAYRVRGRLSNGVCCNGGQYEPQYPIVDSLPFVKLSVNYNPDQVTDSFHVWVLVRTASSPLYSKILAVRPNVLGAYTDIYIPIDKRGATSQLYLMVDITSDLSTDVTRDSIKLYVDDIDLVRHDPTSIDETPAYSVRESIFDVYSNPVHQHLYLKYKAPYGGGSYLIYGINTQTIDQKFQVILPGVEKIDVTHLLPGVYVIELYNKDKQLVGKQMFNKQ
jgi:hypothetical protein